MTSPATPYRSDVDALRERKQNLERELAELRRQAGALEQVRAREQEVARALAEVDGQLGARVGAPKRRVLPMLLDDLRVASPCNESWDEMLGDERVRFCTSCEKNVFNLSAMSRDEAEALLAERTEGELCVRFYRRADGTVLTSDCPVGVRKRRVRRLAFSAAGAGAMAFAASRFLTSAACPTVQGGVEPMVMGEVSEVEVGKYAEPPPPPPPVHSASTRPRVPPQGDDRPVRMGKMVMGARRPAK